MSHKVQSLKLKVVVGMALLALPFFGFGMLLGFGCSNSAPPAATPQAQTGLPETSQESLTPEQVFASFKEALAKGDIDAAMQQVHPLGQEKIREMLQKLEAINKLAEFANSLGVLTPQDIGQSISFYEVKVNTGGTNSSFPITFTKDDKNQWKISGF